MPRYQTTRKQSITILGAGIGGLTTAISLHQKGFKNIRIYERRASSLLDGAGLVLWPNASLVFNKLGLGAEVQKSGGTIKKMLRYSSTGEKLGELSIIELEYLIGNKAIPIARKDLLQVLIQRVTDLHIPVIYSRNVKTIYSDENEKTCIEFDDHKRIYSDIIIGADGRMKSIARKFVAGSNSPRYQHYINWVALIEGTKHVINEDESIYDYWGIGERFGYVPINKNRSYWAGCKKLPMGHMNQNGSNKDELISIFKNWPDPIPEIIDRTEESSIRKIEVFDHDPIISWYTNNVCLLGDAAHAALPTSGQGACQAIEDAWHFAECLNDFHNDLGLAFSSYQKLRMQKTQSITLAARGFAESLFTENEDYCKIRNENAMKADSNSLVRGMANLWSAGLPN